MAQSYPIAGVENTGTHPRLEISDLQKNPIQFSLFIRAFNNIQAKKTADVVDNPDSWWQLGTIHGRPFKQWSGDPNGPSEPANPDAYGGYCYHGAVLFPTWHRVQVLLVEQVVVKEAIDIASKLPDDLPEKPTWVQAAKELRYPYWDWTSESAKEGIPLVFQKSTISIANPGSLKEDEVHNPLSYYQYPDDRKPGGEPDSIGFWPRTYRWPVDNGQHPLQEDYSKARDFFGGDDDNQSVRGLRAKIAGLFKYPLTLKPEESDLGPNLWGRFATYAKERIYLPPEYEESAAPLEEPHGAVHFNIGGENGVMSSIDYAGFDPIFYMHHCNVDRIYAFWEYVYPDYWIGEKGWVDEKGNFNPFKTDPNYSQNGDWELKGDTNLIPFRNNDSNYWISEEVRGLLSASTKQKYYTYPGIIDQKRNVEVKIDPHARTNSTEHREKLRQALYNQWRPDLATDVGVVRAVYRDHPWSSRLRNLLLEESGRGRSYLRNFTIIAEVPEFAYPGSYRLELYLIPEDPNYTINVLDSVTVFGRENPEECAACRDRRAAGSSVRGHIYLFPEHIISLFNRCHSRPHPKDRWRSPAQLPHAEEHSLEWLANAIKWSFGLRLVGSHGRRLATADPHIDVDEPDLEEEKKPRLTLHSHRVSFDSDFISKETDRGYYTSLDRGDAVHHGEFDLAVRWKKASARQG